MDITAGTNLKNESEMKKYFFYLSTLALLAAACNKLDNNSTPIEEEPAPAVQMITETVSGGRGTSTKATIAANASFAWTVGDNVAVHVSNGDSHKYVVTSSGASVAAASAKFEVTYEDGYSRDAFAIYPSTIVAENAANYGQSGQPLDVTLPSSYTLDQVSDETSPCPMIATNAPDAGWDFYQLCGLLRLTVNSIPPSTKRLEISFDGKKVAGNFAISDPKGDGSSTIALADASGSNSSVITINNSGNTFYSGWGDGKMFNIPLPVGTYTNITVTAYNALSGGDAVLSMTCPFAYTASKEYGAKRTASFPVFSVSADKRVLFSPGNLQATTTDLGANWTWHFAEHQYDYIGEKTANNQINGDGTVAENGTVDLFQKSTTSYTTYGISNSGDYDKLYIGTFKDWGNIDIDGKGANYWRTLTTASSSGEWGYVLNSRSTGIQINGTNNARYTMAQVNTDGTSVNGLILIPNGFVGGDFAGVTWGTINAASNWTTMCSTDGWKSLEAAGCVFLPITARRQNSKGTFDINFRNAGTYLGNYKKGTAAMVFQTSGVSGYTTINYNAGAVRLVHEVK